MYIYIALLFIVDSYVVTAGGVNIIILDQLCILAVYACMHLDHAMPSHNVFLGINWLDYKHQDTCMPWPESLETSVYMYVYIMCGLPESTCPSLMHMWLIAVNKIINDIFYKCIVSRYKG